MYLAPSIDLAPQRARAVYIDVRVLRILLENSVNLGGSCRRSWDGLSETLPSSAGRGDVSRRRAHTDHQYMYHYHPQAAMWPKLATKVQSWQDHLWTADSLLACPSIADLNLTDDVTPSCAACRPLSLLTSPQRPC